MNYPLISEYIEAVKAAEDNFKELTYLRPVLDNDAQPVMTSGNFAVVFKMQDKETGKFYALKCFTKEQEGRAEAYHQIAEELKDVDSPYLVSLRYLDKELFVDTEQTTETEFPVLLMDWVEGKTLDKCLRENLDDKYALEMLAYRFSQLAQWLIPQPFAHGDLKPNNILVREDGTLVLVDYDGMYVPAMKGQKARELGSPDFRHPLMTENDFDESIDVFPFISILLSIKAISINPYLLEKYGAADRLLFSANDYRKPCECMFLKQIFPSEDNSLNRLISILILYLDNYSFNIETDSWCIKQSDLNCFNTKVSINDVIDKYVDIWGNEYSKDKKRLLKVGHPNGYSYDYGGYVRYELEKGLKVICDNAFVGNVCWPDSAAMPARASLATYSVLQNSIIAIGDYAFKGNSIFDTFVIPESLIYMGRNPFALTDVYDIEDHSGNYYVTYRTALYTKDKKTLIHDFKERSGWYRLPKYVECIGEYSFSRFSFEREIECNNILYLSLPDSVKRIEDYAFMNCNLVEIRMPRNIEYIGHNIFKNCHNLREIRVPKESLETYKILLPEQYHRLLRIEVPILDEQSYADYVDFLDEMQEYENEIEYADYIANRD